MALTTVLWLPLQVRRCTAECCGTRSRTWTQHTDCSWRRCICARDGTDTCPSSTRPGLCTTRALSTAASNPTNTSNTASCCWYGLYVLLAAKNFKPFKPLLKLLFCLCFLFLRTKSSQTFVTNISTTFPLKPTLRQTAQNCSLCRRCRESTASQWKWTLSTRCGPLQSHDWLMLKMSSRISYFYIDCC